MSETQTKFLDWIQLIASLGILAGLVMVFLQMDQANKLTSAQLLDSNTNAFETLSLTISGENPDEAMYRVLVEPDKATDQDYFVAEQLYFTAFQQIVKLIQMERQGLGVESNSIELSAGVRAHWFASPHGLAYIDQLLSYEAVNNQEAWHLY